jgi:hypothetical protein
MKTIEVVISKDGETKVEAVGYSGAECEKATAELEKSLGVAGKRTAKPERYQQVAPNKVGQR